MKSLLFLSRKVFKNKLKETLRHPGRIIIYFIFFAVLFANVFMTGGLSVERDINELYALAFGFFTVNFGFTLYEGFSSGGTMFSLSDINLLFVSPVNSAWLLLYGMINRLGASIVFGMAFLYEYPVLMQSYNLSLFDFAVILLFFALTVFVSRILSMVIYFFTCGDEKRKKICKAVFALLLTLLATVVIIEGELYSGLSLEGFVKGATAPVLKLFPVSGLMLQATESYLEGEFLSVAVCLSLLVFLVALCFFILTRSKKSYYEDVVLTASKSSSAIASQKESVAENIRGKVKTGRTGLKGRGAAAIFFRHMKENKRSKRLLVTSSTVISLIFTVLSIVASDDTVMIFTGTVSIMSFTVLNARWYSELNKPFIYLIPASPVKKLFYASLEQLPVLFAESAVCLLPVILFLKLPIINYVVMVISRVSYGMLMLSSSLVTYKMLASKKGSRIYVTLNSFIAIFFSAPSLALIIMSGMFFYLPLWFAFLLTVPVNFVIMMALFFLSRNIIIRSEL